MSGVEVVGLLLGAIPLIIEGFDGSQKAIAIFTTYRHYPAELRKLDAKLGAQRTCFRNTCINLLSAITNDSQRIHEMFAETSHLGWQDKNLFDSVASRFAALDESFTSCIRTIDQIHIILRDICQEIKAYQSIFEACDKAEQQPFRNKDLYKKFKKRIQLGFNKTRLDKQIKELRSFNTDLNILSDQIIKRTRDPSGQNSRTLIRNTQDSSTLSRYHHVRQASQLLYETLVNRWSCSVHSRHSANISLVAAENIISSIALASQANATAIVRLEMAVTYQDSNQTGNIPIWLEVESPVITTPYIAKGSGLASFQGVSLALETQVRSFAQDSEFSPEPVIPSRAKKAVRFNSDMAAQSQSTALQAAPTQMKPNEIADDLIDLCLIPDVCGHFQSHPPDPQQELCVGYLKDTYVQRFYRPPARKCLNGSSKSLEDVVTWVSQKRNRMFPRSAMFQLACSLASAVLQFHSTPWLPNEWQSRDVVFFGMENFSQSSLSLNQPHLNMGFSRNEGKVKVMTESEEHESMSITSHISSGARNEILFRLGIILLEIGFATPWSTLRSEILQDGPSNAVSDYMIADKLARQMVSSMGPAYSKVVRKCLGCDFGLGETDLSSEDLQARVLLEVVDALEDLAKKLSST